MLTATPAFRVPEDYSPRSRAILLQSRLQGKLVRYDAQGVGPQLRSVMICRCPAARLV